MNEQRQPKIDAIINSLDGCSSAEPSPYLLTRVMAKMANQEETQTIWSKLISIITEPTIALGGLIIIVLLNVFVIVNYSNNSTYNPYTVAKNISISDDLTAEMSGIYEIDNLEP